MLTRLVRSLYLGLLISPHVFAHDQQNQSAFSKLLTSYRVSERVTQLHHLNKSFLCLAYPEVKNKVTKNLIRKQFAVTATVLSASGL